MRGAHAPLRALVTRGDPTGISRLLYLGTALATGTGTGTGRPQLISSSEDRWRSNSSENLTALMVLAEGLGVNSSTDWWMTWSITSSMQLKFLWLQPVLVVVVKVLATITWVSTTSSSNWGPYRTSQMYTLGEANHISAYRQLKNGYPTKLRKKFIQNSETFGKIPKKAQQSMIIDNHCEGGGLGVNIVCIQKSGID